MHVHIITPIHKITYRVQRKSTCSENKMHANDRRSAVVPPLLVLMFLQNRPLTGVAKLYCVIIIILNWIIIKNVSAFYGALL